MTERIHKLQPNRTMALRGFDDLGPPPPFTPPQVTLSKSAVYSGIPPTSPSSSFTTPTISTSTPD